MIPVTSLGGPTIENPANPKGDYGPCSYDAPNVFNASVVYFSHLRIGQSRSFRSCLSDWQIAPLLRYETGFPVNPVDGTDLSLTGVSLDRPNVNPGVPLYIHTGRTQKSCISGSTPRLSQSSLWEPMAMPATSCCERRATSTWIAPSAAPSRPQSIQVDLRVEAFNVTNHPNFGGSTPSTGVALGPNVCNPTSSSFGRITLRAISEFCKAHSRSSSRVKANLAIRSSSSVARWLRTIVLRGRRRAGPAGRRRGPG